MGESSWLLHFQILLQDEPAPCPENEGGPWVVQLLRSITIDSAIFDEVSKIFAPSMANDAIIILSFFVHQNKKHI